MEVRSVRLQDLDFDENNSKSYKEKEKKTAMSTFNHLIRGLQKIHQSWPKRISSTANPKGITGGILIYSTWRVMGVKASKVAGITRRFVHTLRHTLLLIYSKTDSILSLKDLWNIRTLNFCPNPIFMWFY
jgi:integrase